MAQLDTHSQFAGEKTSVGKREQFVLSPTTPTTNAESDECDTSQFHSQAKNNRCEVLTNANNNPHNSFKHNVTSATDTLNDIAEMKKKKKIAPFLSFSANNLSSVDISENDTGRGVENDNAEETMGERATANKEGGRRPESNQKTNEEKQKEATSFSTFTPSPSLPSESDSSEKLLFFPYVFDKVKSFLKSPFFSSSSSPSSPPELSHDGIERIAAGRKWRYGRKSVEKVLEELKKGNFVIVTDDEKRENEGDLILPAQFSTPQKIAYMVEYTSGVLCVAMTSERLKELNINDMHIDNEDKRKTAFTVSVDANDGTTGISASSRSNTFLVLSSPSSTASSLTRPGHVFPLRYREGGVYVRQGHTEASVDLMKLSNLFPAAVIGEIVSIKDPTHMAKHDELCEIAREAQIEMTTIEDIICYRLEEEHGYHFD